MLRARSLRRGGARQPQSATAAARDRGHRRARARRSVESLALGQPAAGGAVRDLPPLPPVVPRPRERDGSPLRPPSSGTSSGGRSSWSLVSLLVIAGLAAGCVLGRRRLALFAVSWVLLSFAGLLAILWIAAPGAELGLAASTAGLLVGGALLVPLALSTVPEPAPVPEPARAPHPLVRLLAPVRAAIPMPHRIPESGPTSEPPAHGLPWRRPRRELLLLVLVAAAALSPVYAIDAQDVSRVCLTQALVHFRVSNDYCLSNIYARDKSVYHGHLYSDKAPGMSVLELPAAEAVRLPSPYHWPYEGLRLWAVRVLASGLALIVGAFLDRADLRGNRSRLRWGGARHLRTRDARRAARGGQLRACDGRNRRTRGLRARLAEAAVGGRARCGRRRRLRLRDGVDRRDPRGLCRLQARPPGRRRVRPRARSRRRAPRDLRLAGVRRSVASVLQLQVGRVLGRSSPPGSSASICPTCTRSMRCSSGAAAC